MRKGEEDWGMGGKGEGRKTYKLVVTKVMGT